MDTKLTLVVNENIKEQAKRIAKEKGESLSHIIENFLKVFISKNDFNKEEDQISPKMKAVIKSLKPAAQEDINVKEEKIKRLEKKYLD